MPVNHIYRFNLKFVIRDVSGHVENMNMASTKYRFMYIHFVFYPFSYFYTLEDAALSIEHFGIVAFFILDFFVVCVSAITEILIFLSVVEMSLFCLFLPIKKMKFLFSKHFRTLKVVQHLRLYVFKGKMKLCYIVLKFYSFNWYHNYIDNHTILLAIWSYIASLSHSENDNDLNNTVVGLSSDWKI